jgi:hypothetical protein
MTRLSKQHPLEVPCHGLHIIYPLHRILEQLRRLPFQNRLGAGGGRAGAWALSGGVLQPVSWVPRLSAMDPRGRTWDPSGLRRAHDGCGAPSGEVWWVVCCVPVSIERLVFFPNSTLHDRIFPF